MKLMTLYRISTKQVKPQILAFDHDLVVVGEDQDEALVTRDFPF
jgi:hypothetical protein